MRQIAEERESNTYDDDLGVKRINREGIETESAELESHIDDCGIQHVINERMKYTQNQRKRTEV